MSRRSRAYVVGYYGMSNFGDDLFCEVMTRRAIDLFPDHDVKIVGSAGSLGGRLYSAPTAIGSIWRLIIGILAVLRADVIVLGGGSVLWRLDGVRRVQWKLSRLARTSFESLGVSIGPFANADDRLGITEFLAGNDRVVVRDRDSLGVAMEMGLGEKASMGGDLAALYPTPQSSPEAERSPHRTVGVALCNFSEYVRLEPEILASLVSAIQDSAQTGRHDRIEVISLNNHPLHGDDALSSRAVEYLEANGLTAELRRYSDLGVTSTWDLMASLDAMVAVRLHSAIPAYLSGVPFALLEYHPKCKSFCDEIGQDASLRWTVDAEEGSHLRVFRALLEQPRRVAYSPAEYRSRAEDAYVTDRAKW